MGDGVGRDCIGPAYGTDDYLTLVIDNQSTGLLISADCPFSTSELCERPALFSDSSLTIGD
jgi:hypothetical protein